MSIDLTQTTILTTEIMKLTVECEPKDINDHLDKSHTKNQ